MEELILVTPNEDLEAQAQAFKAAFFQVGETVIDGSSLWDLTQEYTQWLKSNRDNASPVTVQPDWVVANTFFAIRKCDGKMVGIIDFRHYLNDFLKDFGHIGYSVLPSERKKGYATEMLRQLLPYAKNHGLSEVQLSCKSDNIGSKKAILNNGGRFIRFFTIEGKTAEVFLITL